jgi:hypothetical protein
MFKLLRPRYVVKKYSGRKFPQKNREEISIDDIIRKYNTPKFINKQTNITTIGSCFAQRLRDWLIKNDFNYVDGKWDRVYSPRNIKQILQFAFEPKNVSVSEEIWDFDGDLGHPYVKDSSGRPLKLPNDENLRKEKINSLYSHFKKTLSNCEVLILTFGQTEVWSHKDSPETAFYAAPFVGIDGGDKNHICKDLSINEIKKEVEEIYRIMSKHNPSCKLIFSISPIPLVASINENYSAFISANFAKTKLHSATLESISDKDNCYYMPSFELVNSHPYKSFESDGRHVPQKFADLIMGMFEKLFVNYE